MPFRCKRRKKTRERRKKRKKSSCISAPKDFERMFLCSLRLLSNWFGPKLTWVRINYAVDGHICSRDIPSREPHLLLHNDMLTPFRDTSSKIEKKPLVKSHNIETKRK